jgi:hypothetical protein
MGKASVADPDNGRIVGFSAFFHQAAPKKDLPVRVPPKKADSILQVFGRETLEHDIILKDKDILGAILQPLGQAAHMRFIDALLAIRRMFFDNDELNLFRQADPGKLHHGLSPAIFSVFQGYAVYPLKKGPVFRQVLRNS